MDKKKVMRALMLSLCIVAVNPSEVEAKEDLTGLAKEYGKKFLNKIDEINDKTNEIIEDIHSYKQDSLWLITDIPNVNPSEKRHYYFVTRSSHLSKILYFDSEGNQVQEEDGEAVFKCEEKEYWYVNFTNTIEEKFYMEYNYDLLNQTFSTNFVDFNEDYTWDPDINAEYGRITDVSLVIPEDMQLPEYKDKDLKAILEILNDCNYELFPSNLKLELK